MDIHEYVERCYQCQVLKIEHTKTPRVFQPLKIPSAKWQSISMDFIVDLPRIKRSHNAIFVVVD